MRFPVRVKKLIDGKVQARCIGTVAGEVSVMGDSREEALERMRSEISYRLFQVCSIVHPGTGDDLGVDADAEGEEALELRHDVRCSVVTEQRAAHLEVGGVDGDVERAQTLLLQPLPVPLVEVR